MNKTPPVQNKLLQLALFDHQFKRYQLIRWGIGVLLLMTLVLSLINPIGGRGVTIFFGIFFIILPFEILFTLFQLFLRQEVSRIEAQNSTKGEGMTYHTALLLIAGRGSPLSLWYQLIQDDSLRFLLLRLGVNHELIYKALPKPPDINSWLRAAKQLARSEMKPLAPKHLFEVLQQRPEFIAIWKQLSITDQERGEVWQWYERLELQDRQTKRGFVNQVSGSAGIGRDWSSGYTHFLELFAVDISRELDRLTANISLIGHAEEKAKIIEYLSRDRSHNVILMGDEGIGKQRIVLSLAQDLNKGLLPSALKHKHLYLLDTGKVVSGASQEEIELRLRSIFDEAETVGNVILAVPDFQLLVGAQGSKSLGIIDASAVLTTYLQSAGLQFIGQITEEAYYSYVNPNVSLQPFLLPVEVREIKAVEALRIVEDSVLNTEIKTNHIFTYQSLLKIIEIADEHIHDKPYPEKALSLLDEMSGAIANDPQLLIGAHMVETVMSTKLKIPLGNPGGAERQVLNNLETAIQQRIVGQKEAVGVVANALRRARAGLNSGKRPIGSFLFLGPTGVGKTEMAKTIAALYYQNEKAFIRIDMSEYQTPESIEKLIGAKDKPGLLTTAITDQPFSVVLLDEIEKADIGIRNLFLQVLDDGHITDGFGRKVDFTNAMVIATSNAGSQLIRQAVQAGQVNAGFKPQLLEYLQNQGIFSPEWLNRFDAIVTFLPLNIEEIRQVAQMQVAELVSKLKSHNINLTLQDDVYDVLIQKGYDPQFGARPMRRAVQDVIENALAKVLLNDSTEGMKNITLTKAMLAS